MEYIVKRRNGSVLKRGDTITIAPGVNNEGEEWIFGGAYHPRKVYVYQMKDPDGPQFYPNKYSMEFYASVLDVEISDPETGEVTFALSSRA